MIVTKWYEELYVQFLDVFHSWFMNYLKIHLFWQIMKKKLFMDQDLTSSPIFDVQNYCDQTPVMTWTISYVKITCPSHVHKRFNVARGTTRRISPTLQLYEELSGPDSSVKVYATIRLKIKKGKYLGSQHPPDSKWVTDNETWRSIPCHHCNNPRSFHLSWR